MCERGTIRTGAGEKYWGMANPLIEPVATTAAFERVSPVELASTRRWQRSLKPVMILVVLATAIFFFTSTWVQFRTIETAILQPGSSSLAATLDRYEAGPPPSLDYLKWKNLALIDEQAAHNRTAQASATLLVNVWTRYLGFVTGMVLAITGATFIMARLSEGPTALAANNAGLGATLSTSSPGIVLAVLGTVLMLAAMTIRYTQSGRIQFASTTATPAAGDVPPIASVGETAPGTPPDSRDPVP